MNEQNALTQAELDAEVGTTLPAKEVMSLLDLNIDIDLALALAAPIDLAVAANLNVAAPIEAAVSANVLSLFSNAASQATQGIMLDQYISGEAIADAPQDASITQLQNDVGSADAGTTNGTTDGDAGTATGGATDGSTDGSTGGTTDANAGGATDGVTNGIAAGATDGVTDGIAAGATDGVTDAVDGTVDDVTDTVDDVVDTGGGVVSDVTSNGLLDGNLVNIDVKVNLDADIAAPIAGAVAANANVAAPISAAASANVGSVGSEAIAVADQQAIITQTLDDVVAHATAAQTADVVQD